MSLLSVHTNDVIAKLVRGGAQTLAQFSDDELLANTRRLVGRSNQLLAALLEHLAEVETRGIHRARSCASLYTYCIYELRFSEDAAARRSAAARFAREFPALLDAVAAGELHLTGLLMIAPHLTLENRESVLSRAKFRTKKELGKLVRELNPLPDVPDRIEPLGPAPARVLKNPTWEQFVTSLAPKVRELPAGERPDDWANDGRSTAFDDTRSEAAPSGTATSNDEALPVGPVPCDLPPVTGPQHFQMQFSTVEEHVQLVERAKALLARTRPGLTLGELHFEAMKLLIAALEKQRFAVTERPRRASGVSTPPRQRGDTCDQAAEASVPPRQSGTTPDKEAEASVSPRQSGAPPDQEPEAAAPPRQSGTTPGQAAAPPRQSFAPPDQEPEAGAPPRQRVAVASVSPRRRVAPRDQTREPSPTPRQSVAPRDQTREPSAPPRQSVTVPGAPSATPREATAPEFPENPNASRRPDHPGRSVPAAVRREVYQRDGARCTYVDARGQRCCETRYLEFHHLQPFAKGGEHSASNLTLRCAAHNALAAEEDFGRELVAARRHSNRHETLAAQTRVERARFRS